jgi:Mg2+/Co2+ transporter CorC
MIRNRRSRQLMVRKSRNRPLQVYMTNVLLQMMQSLRNQLTMEAMVREATQVSRSNRLRKRIRTRKRRRETEQHHRR